MVALRRHFGDDAAFFLLFPLLLKVTGVGYNLLDDFSGKAGLVSFGTLAFRLTGTCLLYTSTNRLVSVVTCR